jgi:hypothetical protein
MTDVISDPVLFAKDVLGVTVFEYQEPMVRSTAAWQVVTGGRRSGKTTVSQIKAAEIAMSRRGCQVLITSANESSVRRWISEFADMLAGSQLGRAATVDVESQKVTLGNGSEVIGVPPTARALRGYGRRVWGVIVDEASLCAPTVIADIRFVLLDHVNDGAQGILVGPPMCGHDHPFREMWEAGWTGGDPDINSHQWATTLNPGLDQDWLRGERNRLNSIVAMGELDGQWISDGLQFYPHALLSRAVADIEPPDPRHLAGPAQGILALDIGVVYDTSVIWCLYRAAGLRGLNPHHDPRKAVFIGWPFIFDPGTPLMDVVNTVVDCRAPFLHYSLDTIGAGAMPAQEIVRRVKTLRPVRNTRHGNRRSWWLKATNNATKMASHSLLRWLLENDQLILPRDPTMLRQFQGMRFEQTGRTSTIEAADPATHDDVPDAAALSMLAHTPEGSGRVICALQNFAGETATPESPVEQLDIDIVTTGSGLNVYQQPVLQSVRDGRISIPQGARPRTHHNDEHADLREQMQAALT